MFCHASSFPWAEVFVADWESYTKYIFSTFFFFFFFRHTYIWDKLRIKASSKWYSSFSFQFHYTGKYSHETELAAYTLYIGQDRKNREIIKTSSIWLRGQVLFRWKYSPSPGPDTTRLYWWHSLGSKAGVWLASSAGFGWVEMGCEGAILLRQGNLVLLYFADLWDAFWVLCVL